MIKDLLIRTKLAHDVLFLKLCLIKLYEQQDEDEQELDETRHDNGVGWNKADAAILTPIARDMVLTALGSGFPPERIWISTKSLDECRKRLPKYVGQLITLLEDEEVL